MRKDILYLGIRVIHSSHDEELHIWFYMQGFDTMLDEEESFVFYCEEDRWTPLLREELTERLLELGLPAFVEEKVEQRNWNEEWERSIEPVLVANTFLIHPSWHDVESAPGVIPIEIDPKMSFGTGLHATTRLMMELMIPILKKDDIVLDVGTGTGILAIAGILLGASRAMGVDIDEWSKDNAEENASRNGVTTATQFLLGGIEVLPEKSTFDVVLSNITRNDNVDLLPRFPGLSRPGARLITSGYQREDRDAILAAARNQGYRLIGEAFEDEWAASTFQLES